MTVSTAYRFASHDPFANLAREELLFEGLEPGASALVLYVNRPSIVLGKHQNPLREVRLDEASRRGVPLVRRSSGGGTVWHDEGNLNWSWLGPKTDYDRGAVSRTVAEALGVCGVDLEVGEKGDLFWNEKKVSGAAYLFKRDRVLHHGTLLCRARLDDLRGVLGPTGTLVEWVGVASRPMAVANLGIDVDAAAQALVVGWGGPVVGEGRGNPAFEAAVTDRAAALADPAWLWDQTPAFTWEGPTSLGSGRFRVVSGRVESVVPLSDGVPERDDRSLNMSRMVGKRFFEPALFEYIPTREVV